MKKIGCFKQNNGFWTGTIAVLQFEAKVKISPNPHKTSSETPDFLLTKSDGSGDFELELGAGWRRTSIEQRVSYIEVVIDDPALPRPINAVLWRDSHEDIWFLYWDRHSKGDHIAERLYVQEELKPQLGILPLSRITEHMRRFYPDLVPG